MNANLWIVETTIFLPPGNHPSGSALPSKRDVELTWGLYGAGKMMGIPLFDHLILAARSHYSFADNGRLAEKSNP
ncbi:MAG: JAB domain-containing protein [Kiritimatiellia bacterium]